jgi:hypothetical protein
MLGRLALPGPVHYVTNDETPESPAGTLWLMTQCRHHILSNSSFYWWAAWLAERDRPGGVIIASDMFVNRDTIPDRWRKIGPAPVRQPRSHASSERSGP